MAMATIKRVVGLSARREQKDEQLKARLLAAYQEAKESGSGPGVPRTQLAEATRKRM
jgi:hypothetical protein